MADIEKFNILDARKMMEDIRKCKYYIEIKKRIRDQILKFRNNDDFYFEEDIDQIDDEYEKEFPKKEDLEKMFRCDGFEAEIEYNKKIRHETKGFGSWGIHNDDNYDQPYIHIEITVKNTWCKEKQ